MDAAHLGSGEIFSYLNRLAFGPFLAISRVAQRIIAIDQGSGISEGEFPDGNQEEDNLGPLLNSLGNLYLSCHASFSSPHSARLLSTRQS